MNKIKNTYYAIIVNHNMEVIRFTINAMTFNLASGVLQRKVNKLSTNNKFGFHFIKSYGLSKYNDLKIDKDGLIL